MNQTSFRWLLLKQSLLQKKGKAVLIVLAASMGASVVAALLNLDADLRSRMNRELRDYGPNVILATQVEGGSLPATLAENLRSSSFRGSILAMTPEIFVPVDMQNRPAVLVGADLDEMRKLYPGWEWNVPSAQAGAVVGVRLAKKLGLRSGSTVTLKIRGQELQSLVAGTVESGEAEDDQLFVDLATAQQLGGFEGRFHIVALSMLGDMDRVQSAMNSFVAAHPGTSFDLIRKIAASEALILDKLSRLIGWVILIILVILFFCVNTTVSAILLSRQTEIALMRVLGARRKQIMMGLTLELLILGLLGGVLGYALGMFMAQVLGKVLFHTFVIPRLSIFMITLFASLLMMVISSLLPIKKIINRQAALVLKEA